MLVLVLGWTQCLPQGVGAPPAMLQGRTAGFPKKLGGRRGGVGGYNLQCFPGQSPRLWHTNHEQAVSVWCIWNSSSSSCHQTSVFHLSTHFFAVSLNFLRSSNEQGCVRRVHCIMCAVFTFCVVLLVVS